MAEVEALQALRRREHSAQIEQMTLDHLSKLRDQLSRIIESRQQAHVPAPPKRQG
jgi:hypothetical protein